MSGSLLPFAKQIALTNTGSPGVGYQFFTYAAGTLTPKETFSDAALTVSNANPVVADARGEVTMYGTDTYRIILRDASNNTIWDRDNVPIPAGSADLAAPSGSSLVGNDDTTVAGMFTHRINRVVSTIAAIKALDKTKYTKAFVTGYYADGDGGGGAYYYDSSDTTTADNGGTVIVATDGGRWKLQVINEVSVKQFGVKSDGTSAAANLTQFQAAITWCQDNLKALYIPGGTPSQTYLIGGTLSITKPMKIVTDGSHTVTLQGSGLAAGAYLLDVDGTAYGTFERANIGGFTLIPGAGADCMRVKNASNSVFYDIGLRDARHGIEYTGTRCFSNTFEKIITVTVLSATGFRWNAHTGGGGHTFTDCSFGANTGMSIDSATTTDSVTFYNTNFEQCITNSVFVGGTVRGLNFFGGRCEGCDSTDFNINPDTGKIVSGLNVEGMTFDASDSGAITRINLGGAGGSVRGFNISGNSVGHGTNNFSAAFVTLNGEGESGKISGNYLNGAIASCSVVNTIRNGVSVHGNEGNNGKFAESSGYEASFTPADVSGAGLALTGTIRITRVGNRAFYSGTVNYPTTANTAAAAFGGFPYAIGGLSGNVEGRAGGQVNYISGLPHIRILHGVASNTSASFFDANAGAAATNATLSGAGTYVSGSYPLA